MSSEKIKATICTTTETSENSIHDIVSVTTGNIIQAVMYQLSGTLTMKRTIQNILCRKNGIFFGDLCDFHITEDYKISFIGEQFKLYGTGTGDSSSSQLRRVN